MVHLLLCPNLLWFFIDDQTQSPRIENNLLVILHIYETRYLNTTIRRNFENQYHCSSVKVTLNSNFNYVVLKSFRSSSGQRNPRFSQLSTTQQMEDLGPYHRRRVVLIQLPNVLTDWVARCCDGWVRRPVSSSGDIRVVDVPFSTLKIVRTPTNHVLTPTRFITETQSFSLCSSFTHEGDGKYDVSVSSDGISGQR